jgi:Peptidase M50B-like
LSPRLTSFDRFFQALLIVSTFVISWLGMMIVHEFGHVFCAWLSGGTVSKVVLHPLEFSRTDLSDNPHPLLVVWGGPVVGTLLPLAMWLLTRPPRFRYAYIFQFFAGFCFVVNGIYLGVVSFLHAADPGELMRHGTPQWALVLFGIVAFPLGMILWNGLGPHFGLAGQQGKVSRTAATGTFAGLVVIIAIELLANSR